MTGDVGLEQRLLCGASGHVRDEENVPAAGVEAPGLEVERPAERGGVTPCDDLRGRAAAPDHQQRVVRQVPREEGRRVATHHVHVVERGERNAADRVADGRHPRDSAAAPRVEAVLSGGERDHAAVIDARRRHGDARADGRGVGAKDRPGARAVVGLDASLADPHDAAAVGEPGREVGGAGQGVGERCERAPARNDQPRAVVEDALEGDATVRVDAHVLAVDAPEGVAADRSCVADPAGRLAGDEEECALDGAGGGRQRDRARGVDRHRAAQEAPRVPTAHRLRRQDGRNHSGSVDGEDAGRLIIPGASGETIHDSGERHEAGVIEDGTRPEELEASAAGRGVTSADEPHRLPRRVAHEPEGAADHVEQVATRIQIRDVRAHQRRTVEDRHEAVPLEQEDAVGRAPGVQAGGEGHYTVVVDRQAARETVEGAVERRGQRVAGPGDKRRHAAAHGQHRARPAEEDRAVAAGAGGRDRVEPRAVDRGVAGHHQDLRCRAAWIAGKKNDGDDR